MLLSNCSPNLGVTDGLGPSNLLSLKVHYKPRGCQDQILPLGGLWECSCLSLSSVVLASLDPDPQILQHTCPQHTVDI